LHSYRNERRERDAVRLEMRLGRVASGAEHAVRLERTEGAGDALDRMAGMPGIESLALVETDVTDDDLARLARLPSLERLSIEARQPRFTTRGLERLASLKRLRHLELIGDWASETAVAPLRQALPECEIVAKPAPPPRD